MSGLHRRAPLVSGERVRLRANDTPECAGCGDYTLCFPFEVDRAFDISGVEIFDLPVFMMCADCHIELERMPGSSEDTSS